MFRKVLCFTAMIAVLTTGFHVLAASQAECFAIAQQEIAVCNSLLIPGTTGWSECVSAALANYDACLGS
ncbi:MAG: hypothetical protein QNK37_35650 [Acidobacteriota bacterium]|nr:hypothetical protein [Acidobacteriota bacterium]